MFLVNFMAEVMRSRDRVERGNVKRQVMMMKPVGKPSEIDDQACSKLASCLLQLCALSPKVEQRGCRVSVSRSLFQCLALPARPWSKQ